MGGRGTHDPPINTPAPPSATEHLTNHSLTGRGPRPHWFIMPDDATGNPSPEDHDEAMPTSPQRTAESGGSARPPRPKESWEPQVREVRRPDFAPRLTKTTDLPTKVATERQKSKLGEHRKAAIHWEQDPDRKEDGEDGEGTSPRSPQASGLSRGQIMSLGILGVMVIGLGAAWFAKSLLVGDGTTRAKQAAMASKAAQEAAIVAAASLTDAEFAQATQVMRSFLEALTIEDLRAVVREPERVWPLIEQHHRTTPWKPFVVRRLPTRSEMQLNRDLLAGVAEVNDFQRLVIAMQRTPAGIRVDWESFTGQGEMSWDDFLAQRPTTPVLMRVSLQPDDYYNRDFPNSATHACFRLASRGDTHLLYGYVPRGQLVHTQLVARTRINPRSLPTVRLRFLPDATSQDQVEITELVADGWLVSEGSKVRADVSELTPPATK